MPELDLHEEPATKGDLLMMIIAFTGTAVPLLVLIGCYPLVVLAMFPDADLLAMFVASFLGVMALGAALLLWVLRRMTIKTCRQAGVNWKERPGA